MQTKRIYLNVGTNRPDACFEVTRTDREYGMASTYTAELVSGSVDDEMLEDTEVEAIAQAREEWALEWAAQRRRAS